MSILQKFVTGVVAIVIFWAFISTILNIQGDITAFLIIAAGITLFLVSLLSNIRRNSPLSLGAINRGEFYGVVVIMFGAFFYLNTRIDTLFTIIAK